MQHDLERDQMDRFMIPKLASISVSVLNMPSGPWIASRTYFYASKSPLWFWDVK